jgi:tetratricopeptide (TPR) repeat protein
MLLTRFLAIAALILTLVLPSFVLAEGPAAPVAPAVASNNGAGTNPVNEAAQEEAAGQAAFRQGKFDEALTHFVKSDKLVKHPTALFNQCRCHQEMDEVEKAVGCYQQFIELYPTDDDVGRARAYVAKRKPAPTPGPASVPTSASPPSAPPAETCVLLLREIPANADVTVNGKPVNYKTPVTTDCAMQRIEVLVAGQLVAGGRVVTTREKPAEWVYEPNTPTDPELTKDKTSSGWGRQHWAWTSISVSAIAAAAAGYFTYSCLGNFAKADERNGNHAYTVGEFRSAVSDGENNRTRAIVSGVVAVVAGSLGGYLVITGDDESPTAAIAPSFGGLVLTGTF